jgi:hypothetical protein
MTIYNYCTAEAIRTATAEEVARYDAILEGLTSSQRDTGAVDGSEFGLDGVTIYISR